MNGVNGLQQLQLDDYKILKEDYNCPEDAIKKKKRGIYQLLHEALEEGKNLDQEFGIHHSGVSWHELLAEESAQETYKQIRKNIMNWAKNQTWWDEDEVFCKSVLELIN